MKKISRILIILLFLSSLFAGFIPQHTTAIIIGTGVYFVVGNENYSVSTTTTFSNITIDAAWIQFNGLGFNITSTNTIYIVFTQFEQYPKSIALNSVIMSMSVTTVAGTVSTFNLSGLKPSTEYSVYNGTTWIYLTTSSLGKLQWVYNTWSTRDFTLFYGHYSATYPDTTPIETSVNYVGGKIYTATKEINATGPPGLDNVTLYYRYSADNITWNDSSAPSFTYSNTSYANNYTGGTLQYFKYANTGVIKWWNSSTFLGYFAVYASGTATGGYGLTILNVTKSHQPVFMSHVQSAYLKYAHDIKVVDYPALHHAGLNERMAYLISYSSGTNYVSCYNVTDPLNPTYISSVSGGAKYGMYLEVDETNKILYATWGRSAATSNISSYNISDPSAMYLLGSSTTGICYPWDVILNPLDTGYIYVANEGVALPTNKGITIYNVQNPASITYVKRYNTSVDYSQLVQKSYYLYTLNNNNRNLMIWNVIDPTNWVLVENLSTNCYTHLTVDDNNFIYLRKVNVTSPPTDNGLRIMNISDKDSPVQITYINGNATNRVWRNHWQQVYYNNITGYDQHVLASISYINNSFVSYNVSYADFNWVKWISASNPDTASPWKWTSFDFPNGTGYYQFQSIGQKAYVDHEVLNGICDAYTEKCIVATADNPTHLHANWTTTTSINLTWVKGTGTTNTYLIRKIGSYPTSLSDGTTVYTGTATYYNDTSKNPALRYFYRAYGEVLGTYSAGAYFPLATTDNATSYGASWLEFPGYLATSHKTQVHFVFSNSNDFTTTTINSTTLRQYYDPPIDWYNCIASNYHAGQSFTTNDTRYDIYNISLEVVRESSCYPGTVTIYLYLANTSGATYGLPTGSPVSWGTMDGNSIPGSSYPFTSYTWHNITMSNYKLLSNTKYCFIVTAVGAWPYNHIRLAADKSTPTFTSGHSVISWDGGATYSNDTSGVVGIEVDACFKIWGKTTTTSLTGGMMTSNETFTTSSPVDITQYSLQPGTMYYYYEYTNDTEGNLSRGNIRYSLTRPDVPIFIRLTPYFTNSSIKIEWINGTGSNRTIIARGITTYPSTPNDLGATILYNGTANRTWLHDISFNQSYHLSLFGFTIWGDLSRFSSATYVPWGGMSFNCYNESSGLPIGFSVLVSNREGDQTYYGSDLLGWQFINVSEIPMGDEIGFYVSNSSGNYNSRMYYYDVDVDIFYNLSFYLPVTTTPPLTNDSYYYLITVINEGGQTVDNVYLLIKTYLDTVSKFVNVSSGYTDGNGQFAVYLRPNTLYKISASKDGYTTSTLDYIPSTSIFTFTVKIYFETEPPTTTYLWAEQHTFTGVLVNSTGILWMNYTDEMSDTTSWVMYVYVIGNNGEILLDTYTGINDSFTIPKPVVNTYDYHVVILVDHGIFGNVMDEFWVYGYHAHPTGKASKINTLMSLNFGWNPFGWANTIGMVFLIGIFFSFGRRETYFAAMFLGGLLLFLDIYIGFPTIWNTLAGGMFPVLVIFIAILMLIRDRGMFGAS